MFYMAISALHFGLLYAIFATRSLKPLNNSVVRYYFGSIIVLSVLVMLSLMINGGYDSWGRAAIDSSFTVISYMSTTGFAICDNSMWPWFAGIVLLFVSFHCGCAGSTTGGIKVDRILISLKAIASEIKHRLHPTSVFQVRLGGNHLPESAVNAVLMYIVLYCIVLFVSIIAVLLTGTDVSTAVSGVIASVGSVGPGLSEVGCMDNYSFQPVAAKLIYTVDMFLGRVEIFPILAVVSLIIKRNR
jgi:trk system potassium uptake protein TrkH